MNNLKIAALLAVLLSCIGCAQFLNLNGSVNESKAIKATEGLKFVRSLPLPEKEFVNKLILEKRFDEFEELSIKYDDEFKKNPLYESQLYKLYDAVDSLPELEEPLKEWVKNKPSYMSYCALGSFYTYRGYVLRGEKYARDTPKESLRKMRELHALAKLYLRKSIEDNNLFVPAYCQLISAEKSSGSIGEIDRIHNKAIELVPESYYVRAMYLNAIVPKWGGSYDKMSLYLQSINYDQLSNPRIWSLQGMVDREKGYSAYSHEKYLQSIDFYNKSLIYGDGMYVYLWRSYSYWKVNNLKESLADLRKYLEYDKNNKKVQRRIRYLSSKLAASSPKAK